MVKDLLPCDASIPLVIEKSVKEKLDEAAEALGMKYSTVMRKLIYVSLYLLARERSLKSSLVDTLLLAPSEAVARGRRELDGAFEGSSLIDVVTNVYQLGEPLENMDVGPDSRDIMRGGVRVPSSLKKYIAGTVESMNRKRRLSDDSQKDVSISDVVRSLVRFSLPLIENNMTLIEALEKSFPDATEENKRLLYILFNDMELRYFIIKSMGAEAEKM